MVYILRSSSANGMLLRNNLGRISPIKLPYQVVQVKPLNHGSVNPGEIHLSLSKAHVSLHSRVFVNRCRELTWLRDAFIMFKYSLAPPDKSGAAEVQNFFLLLHDLWCAQKTCCGALTAKRTKFKRPSPASNSVNNFSQLPAIVEMALAAKLADPDERMGFRSAIQSFLSDNLLDRTMIMFLQDILQRVSSFSISLNLSTCNMLSPLGSR